MSKGLEALNNLLNDELVKPTKYRKTIRDIASVGQVLVIKKELKEGEKNKQALEIIRNKRVNVDYFIYTCVKNNWSYEDYLDEISNSDNLELCGQYCFSSKQPILTQEEYDLLKVVLL